MDLAPFPNFPSAASAVTAILRQQFGLDVRLVTRTEGNDWIVLPTMDQSDDGPAGEMLPEVDSFCAEMVLESEPRAVLYSASAKAGSRPVPATDKPAGSCVGIPLLRSDGSTFGALYGIHRSAQPEELAPHLVTLQLLARLLASLLEAELKANEEACRAERAEVEAFTDSLTGMWNRRAWDKLLRAEEARCRRYGHLAAVVSVDLDGLKAVNDSQGHATGDELLRKTARALRTAVRQSDVVARVGGDEFAVLAVECDPAASALLVRRIRQGLAAAQIAASLGVGLRHPSNDLHQTWHEADRAMYRDKNNQTSDPPCWPHSEPNSQAV